MKLSLVTFAVLLVSTRGLRFDEEDPDPYGSKDVINFNDKKAILVMTTSPTEPGIQEFTTSTTTTAKPTTKTTTTTTTTQKPLPKPVQAIKKRPQVVPEDIRQGGRCLGQCPPPGYETRYKFAHASDCNKFCVCRQGMSIQISCPPFLHFDPWRQTCVFPNLVRCPAFMWR